MKIKTAYSEIKNVKENAANLKSQLGDDDYKLIIYFASSIYDENELAAEMKNQFGKSQLLGSSSSGEIVSGKMLKNSIVAMGLTEEIVADVKISVMENIAEQPAVDNVFNDFEDHYKTPSTEWDYDKYFGLILVDGLSGAEEKIMDNLGNKTNVIFIGGSAGDDLKFEKTNVFANGKSYTNAAVMALVKANAEFEFIKTQSFNPTDIKLKATKVDEANRVVLEFNNEKAVAEYAKVLNSSVDDADKQFMSHPVGLMVGDEPYVRSPQQVNGDAIKFYCNVKEGMELSILKSTDIISDTTDAVEKYKDAKGIINFNCILRTLEMEATGKTEDYGKIFNDIPTVGFSTYGEEFIGHINQTATMLVFK